MAVSTNELSISQRELAAALDGLAFAGSEQLAIADAAYIAAFVKDLRERARTGQLTAEETRILQGNV